LSGSSSSVTDGSIHSEKMRARDRWAAWKMKPSAGMSLASRRLTSSPAGVCVMLGFSAWDWYIRLSEPPPDQPHSTTFS
jgi:hypothetical protein